MTGSAAIYSQTAAGLADVAVEIFLLIGVSRSARPADPRHPLGYGRERFFWSLFAAIGIFVGGGGVAIDQAIRMAQHPTRVTSYTLGYAVLAITVILDSVALAVILRPVRVLAAERGQSLRQLLVRSTDPATTTVVVGTLAGVVGGLAAIGGLTARQLTGSATPDALASALIGVVLMAGSVQLVRTNRDLLTGRGVAPALVDAMRVVIEAQAGVLAVPDLFAVVVGPSTLVVNGDVTIADDRGVPEVEAALASAAEALRRRWPFVVYVYLTPVAQHRPRNGRLTAQQLSLDVGETGDVMRR